MVLLQRFCFVFSIRLGSIIVGAGLFLLNLAPMVLLILWVRLPVEDTRNYLVRVEKDRNIDTIQILLDEVHRDPALYSQLGLSMSVLLNASCLVEIYGAYTCKELFLVPFIVLTILLDVGLLGLHVVAMMTLKGNSQDLGLLIGATISGTFVLLFKFYCTACVVSLWQVLREPMLRELAQGAFSSSAKKSSKPASHVAAPRLTHLRDDPRYSVSQPRTTVRLAPPLSTGSGYPALRYSRGRTHHQLPYPTIPMPGIFYPYDYPTMRPYGALIAPIY